jgi:hypothetical protein
MSAVSQVVDAIEYGLDGKANAVSSRRTSLELCLVSHAGCATEFRGGTRQIGRPAFLAFLQHECGHRIAGKVVKDSAIGALGRHKIAGLEFLRGLPSHRAQLLVPIANP